MLIPGFTAEAALGRSRRGYRSLATGNPNAQLLTPQIVWGECSDGEPQLCYFCDSAGGCSCDWYYGDAWIVSSDCGSG